MSCLGRGQLITTPNLWDPIGYMKTTKGCLFYLIPVEKELDKKNKISWTVGDYKIYQIQIKDNRKRQVILHLKDSRLWKDKSVKGFTNLI